MTDVTEDRDQAAAELSAADEQVLRELTERARTGGLKMTGEGGLLGKLTKMVAGGALEGGVDDLVISLSARGLQHGEIGAPLVEVYGAEVSRQPITVIPDRVMEGLAEWQ